MEVIIYADSLFILSFLYNIILFWMLKIMFYHDCRFIRIAGAALFGAITDTLSPLLQIKAGRGAAILTVLFIFPVIRLLFKESRMKRVFSVWVAYVFLSFFMAGIYQFIFFEDTKIMFIDMLKLLTAGMIFVMML